MASPRYDGGEGLYCGYKGEYSQRHLKESEQRKQCDSKVDLATVCGRERERSTEGWGKWTKREQGPNGRVV